jgi:two-component system, cell cycle response regulator
VLAADDDPVTRTLLRSKLLGWGYDVASASDGDQAWSILHDEARPSMALLDWMMPGKDGLSIVRELRKDSIEDPYVYVVLLTSRSSRQDMLAALDAGSDDYMTKPFDSGELRARLRAGERIIRLQNELMRTREELRAQATHDSLTGLWNRPAILELLARELGRSVRESRPIGVALVDVDHFKQFNDCFGHAVGDVVLRQVAHCMSSRLRQYDFVGRYGGDEFLVVMPGCGEPEALALSGRICESVRSLAQPRPAGSPVTVSVGVTAWIPGQEPSLEQLIRVSDCALYAAKAQCRDRAILAGAA